jgi:hypothetical protein
LINSKPSDGNFFVADEKPKLLTSFLSLLEMAFAGPEPDLDEEKYPLSVDTILKLLAQQRQANETIALALKLVSQTNQENSKLALRKI